MIAARCKRRNNKGKMQSVVTACTGLAGRLIPCYRRQGKIAREEKYA